FASSGPCLSLASWSALLRFASLLFNEARRGVNGFGHFCRNKKPVLSQAEGWLVARGRNPVFKERSAAHLLKTRA
ncbi:MAG: hypothetical protein ABI618_16145, partial [Nitrospirota bacterium]